MYAGDVVKEIRTVDYNEEGLEIILILDQIISLSYYKDIIYKEEFDPGSG